MRITEAGTIERAIGEIFDFEGRKFKVVADKDVPTRCNGVCAFHRKHGCNVFECRKHKREDNTYVYFVKCRRSK